MDDRINRSPHVIKDFDMGGGQSSQGKSLISSWSELTKGQTLGKRVVIPIKNIAEGGDTPSPVNVFSVQSKDDFASQLNITLSPIKYIQGSAALTAIGNSQDATGESDNQSPGFANLVGTSIIGDIFARIEWGIGGVSDSADIDFVNGACINIVASFCRMQVFMNFQNVDRFIVQDAAYVLSAFLGPGFPKARNAQRSVILGNGDNTGRFSAAGENSIIFPIPKYAKSISLYGSQVNNAIGIPGLNNPFSGKIVFLRGPVIGAPQMISEVNFTEDSRDSINVPNGALFFYFRNTTLTAPAVNATTRAIAVFDLAV